MTASTASDPSGVEYSFTSTAGGGHDSGWQDSPTYEDTGLLPDTSYTYTVTARDKSPAQNTTAASSPASATTGIAVSFIDIQIATGNDDAEERQSGSMRLGSSDLEFVDDGSNTGQTVGMRFAGVGVPQGATIIEASVQFQADETDIGSVSLVIHGQAANDTATFTSASGDISLRSMTLASVPWSPVSWTSVGARGEDQRTPDLSEVIQEIVDRPDWSPGNAMTIIVTGSGERTAESYGGSQSGAPLLHIEYDPTG